MSVTVELFGFTPSQKCLDNPDSIKTALGSYHGASTLLHMFYGLQMEDQTGYIVLIWEAGPDTNLIDLQGEEWKPIATQLITTFRTQMSADVVKAFQAPVTEFALATLKTPENKEPYAALAAMLLKRLSDRGTYGPSYGEISTPGSHSNAIIIGWDSREAHLDEVREDPDVPKLFELADLQVVHTVFKSL